MAQARKTVKKSKAIPPGPPPSVQDDVELERSVTPLPVIKEETPIILPPIIITNPREKIEAEYIRQSQIKKFKERQREKLTARIWLTKEEKKDPVPKHPISLTWWPKELCFRLDDKTVLQRLLILLAPGLVAELYIRAKPREESPVPHAYAGLQLATAHRKDNVVGYFVVPIGVIFHNYTPPVFETECESVEEIEE